MVNYARIVDESLIIRRAETDCSEEGHSICRRPRMSVYVVDAEGQVSNKAVVTS